MRRMLAVAAATAGVMTAGTVSAQEPADTGRVHVVRRGDTLWDLARRYLEDPFLWTRIYRLNTAVVEDPHWIFPAERLLIPGRYSLLGVPAGGEAGVDPRDAGYYAGLEPAEPPRTVFYPRASTEGRTLLGPNDVPTPAVAEGEFYTAGVIAPPDGLPVVGRLVEILSPTVVPGHRPMHALPFQTVYMVVSDPSAVRRGQMVQLMSEGRPVRPYGVMHVPTGLAQIVEIEGTTATLEVKELFDAVAVGNLAVPLPDFSVPLEVRPQPVTPTVEGRIIAFETRQPVYAVRDVGFVDLGRSAGLTEGDVLEAVIDREERSWGTRPEVAVARFQVVRAMEQTAAVQVISLEHPALEPGMRVRLVAKMPAS